MNLQGHKINDVSESRPVSLSLVCLDGAKAWLSCQAITWISVLAELLWVFANPVIIMYYDIYVHVLHNSIITYQII